MKLIRLKSTSDDYFQRAWNLYEEAFPLEERRLLEDQSAILNNDNYHFDVLVDNNQFIGFILWWDFEQCSYIDHFATAKEQRNRGLGQFILNTFIESNDKPILLEVELPTSSINERRIKFYERVGFQLNQHYYEVPVANGDQSHLQLLLMSYPNLISEKDVNQFINKCHPIIFKKNRIKINLSSVLVIIVLLFSSCKEKKDNKLDGMEIIDEFVSRIHTSKMGSDLYQILGKTSLEKHNADFVSIDWKSNYWAEFEAETFNMTDLEVLNKYEQRYLSVSTAPNTEDSFQFVVGFGTHFERDDPNKPYRKIKLYMTESENVETPKELLNLFFKKDFEAIENNLKNLYLMDEIEDLYRNVK